jgi:cytochrome c oxidase subunit 2
MSGGFRLFPERASTSAAGVDGLYLYLVLVSAVLSALIFILVITFAVKYRRRPGRERATAVRPRASLEIAWMIVPLGLCLVMFFWGAKLYVRLYEPPPDAMDIYVVARQWMWKLQHPEGAPEINELHVPVRRPVRLVMTSQDVIHSFYVPAFRIKQDVLPNRYTSLWFQATQTGQFDLFCAEYCGTKHSGMTGRIIVMDEGDYERWMSSVTSPGGLAAAGLQLFQGLGCSGCHTGGPDARAPRLEGLFGTDVRLEGGGTIVADESYLRESILDPRAKIVSGFQPIMPVFRGQVSEEDVLRLIIYLKSLATQQGRAHEP